MPLTDRLKEARARKGLTQEKLAKEIGVAKSTYTGYEKGNSEPNMLVLSRIMNALSVDANFLFQDEMASLHEVNATPEEMDRLIKKYRSLDDYGKEAVESILDIEHRRCDTVPQVVETPPEPSKKTAKMPKAKKNGSMVEIKVYDEPAAAGLGNYLDDPDFHIEQYPEHVLPSGTDFGVRIDGDSMEPKIHNGYTVFVKAMPMIEPGQFGIFVLNGKSYCKKLVVDHSKRQTRLVSLNPKYEDIVIQEFDSFKTLGHVLGQWGFGSREDDFLDWIEK